MEWNSSSNEETNVKIVREHTHKKNCLNLGIAQIRRTPPPPPWNLGTRGALFLKLIIYVPEVNTIFFLHLVIFPVLPWPSLNPLWDTSKINNWIKKYVQMCHGFYKVFFTGPPKKY